MNKKLSVLMRTLRAQGQAEATAIADVLDEVGDPDGGGIELARAILVEFREFADYGLTKLGGVKK